MTGSKLVHKPVVPSDIKNLVHDLVNKKCRFSFLPEKVIYMNNGIEYYYIEAEGMDGSKFIINKILTSLASVIISKQKSIRSEA